VVRVFSVLSGDGPAIHLPKARYSSRPVRSTCSPIMIVGLRTEPFFPRAHKLQQQQAVQCHSENFTTPRPSHHILVLAIGQAVSWSASKTQKHGRDFKRYRAPVFQTQDR